MTCWWICDYCGERQDGTEYPDGWGVHDYGAKDACAACIAADGEPDDSADDLSLIPDSIPDPQ